MEDAPALADIAAWINTDPVTLDALEGTIVLLDFWSATDLDCRREVPFLRDLAAAHADDPLTVIGVHAPRYGFEADPDFLADAVDRLGIGYPVALDADRTTWERYGNVTRPRRAVIGPAGRIRAEYIGPERCDAVMDDVRRLLRANGTDLPDRVSGPAKAAHMDAVVSPRIPAADALGNGRTVAPHTELSFTDPGEHELNRLYLDGDWVVADRAVRTASAGSASVRWTGRDAYAVLAPHDGPVTVDVRLDGEPVPAGLRGADLGGELSIDRPGLHHLVSLDGPRVGELALQVDGPGLAIHELAFA